MYTRNVNLLSELVEDARTRYVDINQHRVTIHLADSVWSSMPHVLLLSFWG
jgi:hypothetical protein